MEDRLGHDSPGELPASSPPIPSSRGSQKPKRPPPITPKRFQKFFNPRSSGSLIHSRSGRELRDLTSSDVNRKSLEGSRTTLNFDDLPVVRSSKRRKAVDSEYLGYMSILESSPPRSSPCQRAVHPVTELHQPIMTPETTFRLPIRRAPRQLYKPCYPTPTTQFYSNSEDVHRFDSVPFSTVACNTNSLVAVGDEFGVIHLLESAKDSKPEFSKAFLSFQPHEHENAIMHMAFSSDDGLLATGSGDQTACIVDMPTQTVTHTLRDHKSSVKQVAFRPGHDNIVATSCREGVVSLWDLRSNSQTPATSMKTVTGLTITGDNTLVAPVRHPQPFTTIVGDHSVTFRAGRSSYGTYNTSRGPPSIQDPRSNVSITSLTFLEQGRDHLFLTAADQTSHLSLWDIRVNYNSRRGCSVPLSLIAGIDSHQGKGNRRYGINSLSLSTDGARLYSVCRDNTVYVYATNHLILGHAPELTSQGPSRRQKSSEIGLGPLYGLRHPMFITSTFYIRSSLRKATTHHEELLAIGSSSPANGPVVFNTNEKLFRKPVVQKDCLPIYNTGTWLTGGHNAEATGTAWTSEGDLVSLSDDGTSRVWREGTGSRQHGWGWADVDAESFEDDD